MRFLKRRKPAEPAGPCGHPDDWTPEAIIYSDNGMRVTFLFVTCMSCGWQGQVEPSAMPKEPPR